MLRDRIHELKEVIERIAGENRAVKIRLFGSVARGEERPDSDVDFLILPSEEGTLFDHMHLKFALEELLERRVDVVSERALRPPLARLVLKEAVPL